MAATLTADADSIAALPLAHVQAGAALPLGAGLNPAWAARMATLRDAAVTPLLGARDALTEADWLALKDKLAPYVAWLAAKPDPAAEGDGVRQLERLAHYVRDLMPLANNFVAFRDFYTRQGKATFQVGTLYLDGRSCELCVAVNDAARHAALATLSRICLVYCDCVRGAEKLSIAAAFTAGDSDQLMVGRNGVFYDRQGRDWDATITKIVDHPISLRQAFWSPYKRLARFVGEQLQKLAASKAGGFGEQADHERGRWCQEGGRATAGRRAAAVRRRQVRRHLCRHRPGRGRPRHGRWPRCWTGLLALKWWQLPIALAGLMLLDLRPGGDPGLVQAAQPQPRPHPRRQWLGHQCTRHASTSPSAPRSRRWHSCRPMPSAR